MSVYANNPCRYCEERHEGCHGKCEKYISWKNGVNEKKNSIYKARKGEVLASSFTIETVYKIISKSNSNKKRGQY